MEKTNTIVTYDIGRKTGKRPCIPMKYMASVGVLLLQPPQRCQAAELAQNLPNSNLFYPFLSFSKQQGA